MKFNFVLHCFAEKKQSHVQEKGGGGSSIVSLEEREGD